MSLTSLPSPLSIDPPQRDLLPKPAEEVSKEVTNNKATDSLPTSMIRIESSSTETIIGRNLCVLAEYMQSRPANASLIKVIAVDGPDRYAVHGMIANLQHRITRDLQYIVRVINEDSFYPPNNQPTELSHFIGQVQSWGAMWEMILHAPSVSSDLDTSSRRINPTPMHPDYPVGHSGYPVVYILPLSPLMTTMRAIHRAMGSRDPWRWLSGYWKDSFRPDVMINIQDIADTSYRNEVLRIQIHGMNALIVTKEGHHTGLNITPQQLRRVVFEVEEWIR